ncbi:tol-pal system-associated acyl-CoA thioesterase [soil metagenome]
MPHRFHLRVYWEDTDAAGIVYHANYLKFAERARTEALIARGLSQTGIRARHGLVFAVREAHLRFRASARLEDQLVVTTEALRIAGASIALRQAVLRGDEPLAECAVTLACLDAAGGPRRLPAALREALAVL